MAWNNAKIYIEKAPNLWFLPCGSGNLSGAFVGFTNNNFLRPWIFRLVLHPRQHCWRNLETDQSFCTLIRGRTQHLYTTFRMRIHSRIYRRGHIHRGRNLVLRRNIGIIYHSSFCVGKLAFTTSISFGIARLYIYDNYSFLGIIQYRLRSPHSPLPAVPFPRWGTLMVWQ